MNEEVGFPLVLCKKLDDLQELKDNTQFHDLIACAKRCGLITKVLFDDCNYINEMRNNLHLSAMSEVDDKYTRKQLNDVFVRVKRVINRIEGY